MEGAVVKKLHDACKEASEDHSVQNLYKKFDIDHHYASGDDFRKPQELGLQTKN